MFFFYFVSLKFYLISIKKKKRKKISSSKINRKSIKSHNKILRNTNLKFKDPQRSYLHLSDFQYPKQKKSVFLVYLHSKFRLKCSNSNNQHAYLQLYVIFAHVDFILTQAKHILNFQVRESSRPYFPRFLPLYNIFRIFFSVLSVFWHGWSSHFWTFTRSVLFFSSYSLEHGINWATKTQTTIFMDIFSSKFSYFCLNNSFGNSNFRSGLFLSGR